MKIDDLISRKEYKHALNFLCEEADRCPERVETIVLLLYLLHYLLVEEECSSYGLEHDSLADELLTRFNAAQVRFKNDLAFLFFMGIIAHVAEWYFGQDDVSMALKMQKRAMEMSPQNQLFEFSYLFSIGERDQAISLAKNILGNETYLQWLRNFGFAGDYVINLIKFTAFAS